MCILLHKSRIKTQIVFTFPAPGARNWADAGTHTHRTPSTMRKSSSFSPRLTKSFAALQFASVFYPHVRTIHSVDCTLSHSRVVYTIFLTFLTVHFPLRPVGQGLFCREEISYAGCYAVGFALSQEERCLSNSNLCKFANFAQRARTSRTNKRHTLLLYNVGMTIAVSALQTLRLR
jgi:hypothetical protein